MYDKVISFQDGFRDVSFMILSPLFVLIGALPFFVNNYFVTKNPFVPPWAIWEAGNVQGIVSVVKTSAPTISGSIPWTEKIIHIFLSEISFHPDSFFGDIYGVFFNPQNGGMGVFCLTPLFLIALFLIPIIILIEKHTFSQEDRFFLISMIFFSVLVLAAYITKIYGINTSPGIVPDIRYLSPAYLPLNVVGLIVLKKIPDLSENSSNLLKIMFSFGILLIPVVLVFNVYYYPFSEQDPWSSLFIPLNAAASIGIYILISAFLLMHVSFVFLKKQFNFWRPFLISAILCTPFIWQVAATFIMRIWGSGLGGYSFWIPIVRVIYSFLFF
jgi:hypothetical protein